ncbi:MAG: hypothetical protein EBZ77_04345 [Chitinophagia bacterium]|nr:hypothetical protein [Chitinophagia bacterium]
MKLFRYLSFTAILFITAVFGVTYFACTKDKCNGVACLNGGSCDQGDCLCKVGYEGNRCQLPSRDKIIGNYNGGDTCTKGLDSVFTLNYPIRFLVQPGNATQMVMKNILNNPYDSAVCSMQTIDSFIFSGNNSAVSYVGSGRYHDDTIFLNYHVQYDTSNYDCQYRGLKH